MKPGTKYPPVVRKLLELNKDNGVQILPGGSHWKIKRNGILIGILPGTQAKEGISLNLASQLKRAGVNIPRRKG